MPFARDLATRARRLVALALYYGVASRLPDAPFPPGGLWRRARGALCKAFLASTGDWINVGRHVYLGRGANVRLGEGSGFGRGCRVFAADIGRGVMVAPEVVFLGRNHRYDDPGRPIGEQGPGPLEVPVVEDWAWIGYRAIILPGRRVGRGAIVGAGAVVTRDVAPFDIVAGNPATVVGSRRRDPDAA
jgi:maltose O-acetyltransferase